MLVNAGRMFLVGLTGGIGSGKSTVARLFRKAGWPTIDTDALTHELLDRPDASLAAQLVHRFGPSILGANGAVDRTVLGPLVFSDPGARKALEAMLHPAIERLLNVRLAQMLERGEKQCLLEIPLLVEVGWDRKVDFIVTVETSPAEQVERASRRLGISRQQVGERIAQQATPAQRMAKAHFVLRNEGSILDLETQFPALIKAIEEARK